MANCKQDHAWHIGSLFSFFARTCRPTPLQHYAYALGGSGMHMILDERGIFRCCLSFRSRCSGAARSVVRLSCSVVLICDACLRAQQELLRLAFHTPHPQTFVCRSEAFAKVRATFQMEGPDAQGGKDGGNPEPADGPAGAEWRQLVMHGFLKARAWCCRRGMAIVGDVWTRRCGMATAGDVWVCELMGTDEQGGEDAGNSELADGPACARRLPSRSRMTSQAKGSRQVVGKGSASACKRNELVRKGQ
eukprot:scaffold130157_cov20-Tisochrysis_lutea.AAC.1